MQVTHAVVIVHPHAPEMPVIVTEARVVSTHADMEVKSWMDTVTMGPG